MTDPELEAVGREIHGMYHAGASRDEAFARLRDRMTKDHRRIADMPFPLRQWCLWGVRILFKTMWQDGPCKHQGRLDICDASSKV
jgi:hypothetical protein